MRIEKPRLSKPQRYVNEAYLNYVRQNRCVVCKTRPVDAHHVQTRGAGGSDLTAVPLCRIHHDGIHRMGVMTFQTHFKINLFEIQHFLLKKFVESTT